MTNKLRKESKKLLKNLEKVEKEHENKSEKNKEIHSSFSSSSIKQYPKPSIAGFLTSLSAQPTTTTTFQYFINSDDTVNRVQDNSIVSFGLVIGVIISLSLLLIG